MIKLSTTTTSLKYVYFYPSNKNDLKCFLDKNFDREFIVWF